MNEGWLSAKYESGGKSYGSVNERTAREDAGGWTYGRHQLATIRGAFPEFYKHLEKYPKILAQLESAGGLPAAISGSPNFVSMWKYLGNDPAMAEAQHSFFLREYRDGAKAIADEHGLPWSNEGVRESIISAYVNGKSMAKNAVARVAETFSRGGAKAFVAALYDERYKRRADGALAYYAKNSKAIQDSLVHPTKGRYVNEKAEALSLA